MYKLYLDQSTASRLIEENSLAQSFLFSKIKNYQDQSLIEVWSSPHNAMELAVWSDHLRRQAVSLALEELTEGKRVLASFEFVLLQELLGIVNQAWPRSTVNWELFHTRAADNQRVYSGLIAHMAALTSYDANKGAEDVIRTKRLSQLRQLEFLSSAQNDIDLLINKPEEFEAVEEVFDSKYSSASPEELLKLIQIKSLDLHKSGKQRNLAQKMEKNRSEIIKNLLIPFTVPPINIAIGNIFERIALIGTDHIVKHWNEVSAPLNKHLMYDPLPSALVKRYKEMKHTNDDFLHVVDSIIHRITQGQWMPRIMLDFLLREIEKALKNAVPPTAGLTIDIDHISALFSCDIFFSHDNKLNASLKTWFKNNSVYGLPPRYCIRNISDLKRILKQ